MNPKIGWALALAALATGWLTLQWQGVAFAFSVIVFWLLLQFSRVMRVLRRAGSAPKGSVASAVMLHTQLHDGIPLMDVIAIAGSLGIRVTQQPEVWRWQDQGGVSVELEFAGGRCVRRTLSRPEAGSEVSAAP